MEMPLDKASIDNEATPIGYVYARFFSSGVLRELAQKGHSSIAGRLARQFHLFEHFDPTMAVGKFYDTIFKRLVCEYRHEYIYKNAIAEKVLLGKHSLNTAFMLTEFRVDDCKADVVVLNGTSHAYEIKSELDTFERIDRQLAAYQKMFDFITVITSECLYESIEKRIPKEVGIMVLADGGYHFRIKGCRREATSNKTNVDPIVIFNSLQKKEYLKIIKDAFGVSFAHLPNTEVYREAKACFGELAPEVAHDAMVKALKQRRDTCRVADFVLDVSNSLKAASLSIHLKKEERVRFLNMLHKDIASAFA